MVIKVFRGERLTPRHEEVWPEEFRIKNLTPAKLVLIRKLSKNRPLKEKV